MKKIKKLLPVLLMSIMSVSAFAAEAVIDGISLMDGKLLLNNKIELIRL